eukprot:359832-Chlamydomonas_euryale.AAC.16
MPSHPSSHFPAPIPLSLHPEAIACFRARSTRASRTLWALPTSPTPWWRRCASASLSWVWSRQTSRRSHLPACATTLATGRSGAQRLREYCWPRDNRPKRAVRAGPARPWPFEIAPRMELERQLRTNRNLG